MQPRSTALRHLGVQAAAQAKVPPVPGRALEGKHVAGAVPAHNLKQPAPGASVSVTPEVTSLPGRCTIASDSYVRKGGAGCT